VRYGLKGCGSVDSYIKFLALGRTSGFAPEMPILIKKYIYIY